MKIKLYLLIILFAVALNNSYAQTNKDLSNLTSPTAINQTLLPDVNNSRDLGSSSLAWKNIYFTNRIYLDKKIVLHAPGSGNFFAGSNAGTTAITGANNTGTGQYALGSVTSGINNSANGNSSLYYNTSGRDNTVNGYISMYLNTTGSFNTASGTWSLYSNTAGNNNTAYGYSALWQNTTGNDNTAIGKYAMYSNATGYSNIALGTMALFKSVKTTNAVAIGDSALYNYTGETFSNNGYNTAVGSKALYGATTCFSNTAFGALAMYNTTTGSSNVGVGESALHDNIDGLGNTAVGRLALSNNLAGTYNTAIGVNSLGANQNGFGNTAVGGYTGPNNSSFTNSTAIGYFTTTTASNQVRIGNTNVTSIGGQVGWTTFSDGRYKKDIKENVSGLAFINSLRPITYTVDTKSLNEYLHKGRKDDDETKKQLRYNNAKEGMNKASEDAGKLVYDGFVAQEVEAAAKKIGFEFSGVDKPKDENGLYGLRYDNFVVPLVKAVQELSKENDSLKKQNDEQEKRIERLETLLNVHTDNASRSIENISITDASLDQNIPNPFSNFTTIHYTLPQKFTSAQIVVTDKNGKALKQINLPAGRQGISGSTKGIVNIDAATLSAGAYNYSMVIDGRLIDTKQMIITK